MKYLLCILDVLVVSRCVSFAVHRALSDVETDSMKPSSGTRLDLDVLGCRPVDVDE